MLKPDGPRTCDRYALAVASATVCDMPVSPEPGPLPGADCCRPLDPRIERHFDRKMRQRVADGVRPPLHAVSQRLLDALAGDATEAAPSVLEIGCGGGALTIGLLERGATSATGVDLSNESLAVARARAEAAGLTNRTRFEMGDGASVRLVPHDWVVLDRVLCCYPDLDRLLANSVSAAERRYAFSVPASSGWRGFVNRIWFWLEDATEALRGRPCPGYVHNIRRIEARLIDAGFRRTWSSVGRLWYVAVFDRA